jgi:F-type H+-transporting ATPase subunit gamma
VAGKTQLAAYRVIAGDLRLSYAQFEDLEAFARFGTQLDEATRQTLERGLHVVLTARRERARITKPVTDARLGALVFGSDQGMCGQINEQVVAHALTAMDNLGTTPAARTVAAVGARVAARLAEAGQAVDACFAVPSALPGVTPMVWDLLLHLEAWHTQRQIARMCLFYSQHLSSATFRPHTVHLLPVHQGWLTTLATEAWPTRVLPTFPMDWDRLFSALMRQYLFVSLYRACAESLASENAGRLAAMQGAAKNIDERLTVLQALFRQQRQAAITAELFDIVAGFEALIQPVP